MWIRLIASDGAVFDVNAADWHQMGATELPRLADGSSDVVRLGLVRKTEQGLQFNVSREILRPLVDALQRIFMASLPAEPSVAAEISESFWMLCELLRLRPYFSHACMQCKPRKQDAAISTPLCPLYSVKTRHA
jgi:hypothetical protein